MAKIGKITNWIDGGKNMALKTIKNYMDRIENFAASFGVVYSNKTGGYACLGGCGNTD